MIVIQSLDKRFLRRSSPNLEFKKMSQANDAVTVLQDPSRSLLGS